MVKSISELCRQKVAPRIIGIDDAPFQTKPRVPGSEVHAVAIVTTADRFEGMLYCGNIIQDGMNAGHVLSQTILTSKFHSQIHAVFLDGITMGGFNVIDIQCLADELHRPVVAVMRTTPDMESIYSALSRLPHSVERRRRIDAAGPVHHIGDWIFQYRCPACSTHEAEVLPEEVALLLTKCTPQGTQKIPECLRIAHLIGAAIKTGQSSSSA